MRPDPEPRPFCFASRLRLACNAYGYPPSRPRSASLHGPVALPRTRLALNAALSQGSAALRPKRLRLACNAYGYPPSRPKRSAPSLTLGRSATTSNCRTRWPDTAR